MTLAVTDATSTSQDTKTTLDGGEHVGHVNVDNSALPTGAATSANQATTQGLITTLDAVVDSLLTAAQAIQSAVEGTLAAAGTGSAGTPAGGVLSVQGVASGTAMAVDGSGVTQPVSAASLPLPTGAATAANQGTANSALSAIQTAVELLDNVVSGAEAQVDVVTSALPTGAATAANQGTANSALSAIQTAVELLDNAISGSELQVDVVGALPAGTNNIGDVDIASVPGPGSSFTAGAVTSIGTSAVQGSDVSCSEGVWVMYTGANAMYVGGSGVATSSGFPLIQNQPQWLPVENLENLYFISDTSSQEIRYWAK